MNSKIHEKAAAGFSQAADSYERGRPEYPETAINFLVENMPIENGMTVLELGAGTGKLTKALLPFGAKLIALEPVAEMREKLKANAPGAEVMDGVAEKIPLADGSVDVVLVAQAFHWFKGPQALKEIYRVLKPDGVLALIYNVRDARVPWVAQMSEILDAHEGTTPQYRTMEWKRAFEETDLFSSLTVEQFTHSQTGDLEMILDRVRSISYVAAMPTDERNKILQQVKKLIESHPNTSGKSEIRMPYITNIFCSEKI